MKKTTMEESSREDKSTYCMLCQEEHMTTAKCLVEVECKSCGQRGHVRKDCPRPRVLERKRKNQGQDLNPANKIAKLCNLVNYSDTVFTNIDGPVDLTINDYLKKATDVKRDEKSSEKSVKVINTAGIENRDSCNENFEAGADIINGSLSFKDGGDLSTLHISGYGHEEILGNGNDITMIDIEDTYGETIIYEKGEHTDVKQSSNRGREVSMLSSLVNDSDYVVTDICGPVVNTCNDNLKKTTNVSQYERENTDELIDIARINNNDSFDENSVVGADHTSVSLSVKDEGDLNIFHPSDYGHEKILGNGSDEVHIYDVDDTSGETSIIYDKVENTDVKQSSILGRKYANITSLVSISNFDVSNIRDPVVNICNDGPKKTTDVSRDEREKTDEVEVIDIDGVKYNESIDENFVSGADFINVSLSITDEGEINIIHISDYGHEEVFGSDISSAHEKKLENDVSPIANDDTSGEIKIHEKFDNFDIKQSLMDTDPGNYEIISVHVELLRSNKGSSTSLTQIGCVVHGSEDTFFRSIKPNGLEDYLDCYNLGGDLLQALHMTREEDGTFMFGSKFDDVDISRKVRCVSERDAIWSLVKFLQKYPSCFILGIDEDTVAILADKIKVFDEERVDISGFTYWKRVLMLLDVDDYERVDLDDYCGENFASYNSALDIAKMLMKSVDDITLQKQKGSKSIACDFYKLCQKFDFVGKPRQVCINEYGELTEYIEVYNSFRPCMSASISAEQLEQVVISSESDSEPVETGCMASTEHQVGDRIDVGINKQESSKAYWRIGEFKKHGEPCVFCPICNGRVSFKNILSHIIRLHEESKIPITNLLCATCNRAVLPCEVSDHMSVCYPIPSKSNSIVHSETYWKIGKLGKNGYGVVCPWCKDGKNLIHFKNINKHVVKAHVEDCLYMSLLCPSCEKAVVPSEVLTHMLSCLAVLSSQNTASTSITQVLPSKTSTNPRPTPEPAKEVKRSSPSAVDDHMSACYPTSKTGNSNVHSESYWKIAKFKKGHGVFCPWCKDGKTMIRFTNFYLHVGRVHDRECVNKSLLCPSCKKTVVPFEVRDHMSSCVGALSSQNTASATQISASKVSPQPKSTSKPAKVAEVPLSKSVKSKAIPKPSKAESQLKRSARLQNKAQVQAAPPLPTASAGPSPLSRSGPGLILPHMVVIGGAPNSKIKMELWSFINAHFFPAPGGYVHCLWMYDYYQRAMMSKGRKVVVSPTVFSAMVPQLCLRHWGIVPDTAESGYGPPCAKQFQFCFIGIMPNH